MTLTVLQLAGFAALLAWGVHMVQTGVQRTFGPQLRSFLGRALRNRLAAFGAGAAATVALQSSTATGLILSAFAAGGLIDLSTALAVMLGANVGSALVVQILSFNTAAAAPILVLAGVMVFRRPRERFRAFGRVLIGLGLVLTALHGFMGLTAPLADAPASARLFAALESYIPLVVIGMALLTWAAHASLVTIVLSASLAAKGVIGLDVGLAAVLGANLGSALNPLFEGARRCDPASQRAPLGNLMSRVLGVSAALAAFPYLAPLAESLGPTPGRAMVNAHLLFNLIVAAALLPWTRISATLLTRILPDPPPARSEGDPIYLDAASRTAPAVALALATREALRMADTLERMLADLRAALIQPDRLQIATARRLDDDIDRLNHAIKTYAISIPSEHLDAATTERQAQVLAFSTNLEHAGDLVSRSLLSLAARRLKRGVTFSGEGQAELLALIERLAGNVRLAASVFVSGDAGAAKGLVAEKDAFRAAEMDAVRAHFERLRSGNVSSHETSSLHLDALRDLKRVNAHLAEAAAYPILEARGELLPSRLRSA